MKKRITIVIALILVLALLLCSCGKKKTFSYSDPFNEDGYWKDIKASEYVTLPSLDDLEIKQADVDEQINELLENNQYDVQVMDGEIGEKDTVNIDFVGKVDGVEFEGGSTDGKGTDVNIATTQYIDGFLPQLVGHSPGETFDISVTFPDPYENNPDLSGKDAVFTITVNYIHGYVKPEWNDDFVIEKLASKYEWASAAEAEEAIREYLIEDYLYDNSTFLKDVPEVMMNFQKESSVAYYQKYADAYNMSLEDFMTYYLGIKNTDELWESIKDESETYAKHYLIYQAAAEQLEYKVTEDEIKTYFLKMKGTEDYSSTKEQTGLPYIKFMVMCENIIKTLTSGAKLAK